MPLSVIIVGAGIGGLTAAVALRQIGHDVTVLEKTVNKTEVGFAVTLTSNATRVLRSLGMDFKKARMVTQKGFSTIDARQLPLRLIAKESDFDAEERYGSPSLSCHRVDLHNSLRKLAIGEGRGKPVKIVENVFVSAYDTEIGSVTLQSGEVLTADFVCAADGVKSKAHSWIVGEERPARFTGLSNIRFLMPTEILTKDERLRQILEVGEGRFSVYRGSAPDKMILCYPCRDGLLLNFGFYRSDRDVDAGEQRLRMQTNRDMTLKHVEGFDSVFSDMVRQADGDSMYLWKVAERDPLPSFHKGRLIVLGDAAHPMLPTLGNGAAQSIEDAGVLGVVLQGVEDVAEIPRRLAIWSDLRRPRTSAVQLLGRMEDLEWKHSEANKEKLKEFVSEEELPFLLESRANVYVWLSKYDCLAEARKALAEDKSVDRKDSWAAHM